MASQRYADQRRSFFADRQTETIWDTPSELTYTSRVANEFFVACGELFVGDSRCGLVARYQEFLVFFNASIDPDQMSVKDFEQIVKSVDRRMKVKFNGQ